MNIIQEQNIKCSELMSGKVIGAGLSSIVRKYKNKVIKQSFKDYQDLSNDNHNLAKDYQSLANEILINVKIINNEKIRPYTIPFYGYKFCSGSDSVKVKTGARDKDKNLFLEFKYVGKSIFDIALKSNLNSFLKELKPKLLKVIEIFYDNGILHNDTHLGNFYIWKGRVILGDWGSASLLKSEEKKIYMKKCEDTINRDIKLLKILKTYTFDEMKQILKEKGLYEKYLEDVKKEIKYQIIKLKKGSYFVKKIEHLIYLYIFKFNYLQYF